MHFCNQGAIGGPLVCIFHKQDVDEASRVHLYNQDANAVPLVCLFITKMQMRSLFCACLQSRCQSGALECIFQT